MIQDVSGLAACSRSYGGSELSGNRFFLQRPRAGTPSGSLPEALSPPSRPGPRGSSFSWVSRLRVHQHAAHFKLLSSRPPPLTPRCVSTALSRGAVVPHGTLAVFWSGEAGTRKLAGITCRDFKINRFLQAKDLKICPHRNETKTFFIAKQTHKWTHEPVRRSNKKGKKVSGTQLRKHEFLICTELLYITQTAG